MRENQPFGLRMGMFLEDIPFKPKRSENNQYIYYNVPKAHSFFDFYLLTINPSDGLSRINAFSHGIKISAHGTEIREAFEKFRLRLVNKYGECLLSDDYNESEQLLSGSWVSCMLKKECALTASWHNDFGSSLGSSIQAITLIAALNESDEGNIFLQYSFVNDNECPMHFVSNIDEDEFL